MDFEAWMTAIDREIQNGYGVSIHDLPDQPFRDWYEADWSVTDAVGEIVEREIGLDDGDYILWEIDDYDD